MINQRLLSRIPTEQIPVIVYNEASQAQEIAATAVNLLRIGHPAVQVIINKPTRFEHPDSACESMKNELLLAVKALNIFIDETKILREMDSEGPFKTGNYAFLVCRTTDL